MTARFSKGIVALAAVLIAACGESAGVGTSTGNPTGPTAYFPSGLAVASPFETIEDSGSGLAAVTLAQGRRFTSLYDDATNRIDRLLEGETTADCRFDLQPFLSHAVNASCYGPTVAYEAHPNAIGPDDPNYNGNLPSGDVGFWMETDPVSGHACAVSQVNSRLQSMHQRSLAALMGLASLLCTANVNGRTRPTNGTEELTAEMNGLEIPDVTFTRAQVTHSNALGSDEWSYALELTYTREGRAFGIVVELTHIPGSSGEAYEGRLSYRVNDYVDPPGGCPSPDETYNGSLLYRRASGSALNVDVRGGNFCGHDVNGMTGGLVDPTKKFNPDENPNGWALSFDIFTADFDPSTLVGNYAYSWQAGTGDRYTRVLNAVARQDADSGDLEGEAFYGFGDDIETTDGEIRGFFCNWAGPQGSFDRGLNLRNLAQYQSARQNTETGKFDAVTSNITYAPADACDYDGTGGFRYDSDADGTIDTDPGQPITNDLIDLIDNDGDGLFDAIATSGFFLPTSPENF